MPESPMRGFKKMDEEDEKPIENYSCNITGRLAKEAPLPGLRKPKEPKPGGPKLVPYDYIIRDTEYRSLGLALRVYTKGAKTWIVQKKFLGKPKRVVLGSFPQMTKRAASDEAKIVVGKLAQGLDPELEIRKQERQTAAELDREALTVEVAFTVYQEDKDGNSRPATVLDRKSARKALQGGKLWKMSLLDVKPGDLQAEFNRLKVRVKSKTATNGGATQAGGFFRCLRAAFRSKFEKLKDATNPFLEFTKGEPGWYRVQARDRLAAPSVPALRKWWTAVETLRKSPHKQSADSPTIADYLILSLLFGGRRTEMLSLAWANVDLEERTVVFPKTITKNKAKHEIVFGDYAASILQRRFEENQKREEKSEYVFNASRRGRTNKETREPGTRTHIKEPKKAIARVVKLTGRDFSPHDIRRTFASLCDEMGVSLPSIEKALNHSPKTTVERNYIRQRNHIRRLLYQRLEDKILAEVGQPSKSVDTIAPDEIAAFREWQSKIVAGRSLSQGKATKGAQGIA